MRARVLGFAATWLLCVGASAAVADVQAPRLEGMGTYRMSAGASGQAARYFDQGMVLTWGFNPAEAARSFDAAARIDPRCGACLWAYAWSLGPNINADMAEADAPRVRTAIEAARTLPMPSKQRALLDALALRHPASGAVDEDAYEAALAGLARRHPRDADVHTFAAEALMNLHPYDWWRPDGTPQPWTPEIARRLRAALAADPGHPGANHYWIHLMESSREPARGLPSAKRLETAVPGSGHLLHMPAHIYMRVGRYADASAANEHSIAADRRYLAQVDAQGAYRVGYAAHNYHFLWASAAMQGRSRDALAAANATYRVACGPKPGDLSTGTLQHYYALPYYALVRFGKWDEILKSTPPPDGNLPYPLAVWHYARGTANARTGRTELARRDLAELERLAADPRMKDTKVKYINFAASLARIAVLTLAADIALAEGRKDEAVTLLVQATAVEDGLQYDEPHLWLAPTRHALGAAMLAANRAADAERVYREDLAHYPDNGWSLNGLSRALAAQGKDVDARAVEARYRTAWRQADFALAR